MRELLFFYASGYVNVNSKNEELIDYAKLILANSLEDSFFEGWKDDLSKFYEKKNYIENLKSSELHDFEDYLYRYGKWATHNGMFVRTWNDYLSD